MKLMHIRGFADLEHMNNTSCDFGDDLMFRCGIISCICN